MKDGAALLAVLFFAASARADANYQDFPLGERAMGMGGAFAALADDPSASWYNPGGLGLMSRSSATASLGVYGIERRVVETGFSNPVRTADLRQLSFPIISTSLSAMTKFGSRDEKGSRNAIGISLFFPFSQSVGFRQVEPPGRSVTGQDASIFVQNESARTLWVGPSFSRRIGPNFSLGFSIFYDYYTYARSFEMTNLGGGATPRASTVSSAVDVSTGSLLLRLGALLRVDDHWRFGAAFSLPTLQLHGGGSLIAHRIGTQGGLTYEVDSVGDQRAYQRRPFDLRLGGAYQRTRDFAVSFDLSVHGPVRFLRLQPEVQIPDPFFVREVRRDAVVNGNVGVEWLLRPTIPLRAGFYTNFSAAPEIPERTTDPYEPRVHMFGLSASVGYLADGFGLDFGVTVAFGSGVAQAVDEADPTVLRRANVQHTLVYIFISGLGQALARSVQRLLKGVRAL
jgi:long-chain fatty acid transport protein